MGRKGNLKKYPLFPLLQKDNYSTLLPKGIGFVVVVVVFS